LQGIPAGSQLVRVPLRLAITDVMEDEEKQQLVGQVGGLVTGCKHCSGQATGFGGMLCCKSGCGFWVRHVTAAA
jgi:hypothetical protein